MVGIFTGTGFGFERGSGSLLGGAGLLGSAQQGRSGDAVSVNAATGNLLIQKQDEFLVGRGPDASVTRSYNSLTTLADDNGDKWRQSTDRRVYGLTGTLNATNSTVKRVSGDGTEIVYTWDATRAAYAAKDGAGAYDTIVKTGSEWVWTDGDSRTVERYVYDTVGRITSVTDNTGTAMLFAYDGSNRLSTVTTNDGSWIRYDYSGSTSNISQIVTGYTVYPSTNVTLTRTRYGYDGSNRLQTVTVDLTPEDNSVTTGPTYVTTYGYDTSGRVNSITQTDGSSLTITYDGSNRVSTLVQTVASGVTRTTTVNYFAGYSTVTDPNGGVTRLDYDANKNLTKITAPLAYPGATAQTWQFAYNANGDVTSTTDGNSKVTTYANFTTNGLAQTITDRNLDVTTRTFDAANRLLSETRNSIDATGASVAQVTRYIYNAANDLRFTISAEGRVTEYIRNGYGAITSQIDYADTYSVTGVRTETDMANWANGLTDKSSIQRTDYVYDARLNLIKETSYSITSSAGAGLTTQITGEVNYSYDQAGSLLSTNATNKGSTTYIYDGLGRLISTTTPAAHKTTITFDDANTKTTITTTDTTDPTNTIRRTTIETYNKAGDLIQHFDGGVDVSGGGTSAYYTVDGLGRTRITTFFGSSDKIYDFYDLAGRHIATVDATGRITEYRYNPGNQLVGTLYHFNLVSAANLTKLENIDNTLEITSLRPALHAQDVSTWSYYDGEGRLRQTIAGDGSTTIHTYDASGRLQKSTSYFNKVAAATLSGFRTARPTTVYVPTAHASDTVKRYFYDKDGLLTATLDGEKYLVTNSYDVMGRLVSTTAYANATTATNPTTTSFNNIWAGMVLSATQDRTTRYVYDGRGELRYLIDAQGNTTRYDYDEAGLKYRTVTYATPLGTLASYTFNYVMGQLAGQESAGYKRESYSVYDSAGRLAYSLDQNGATSTSAAMAVTGYFYDAAGNLIRTVAYANTTVSTGNQSAMNLWATNNASADDRVTRMWYNGRNQLAYTVDAQGFVSRRSYDVKGRLAGESIWETAIAVTNSTTYAQVTAAATGTTYSVRSYAYDALDRVVRFGDHTNADYTEYTYLGATDLVATATRALAGTAQEQSVTANTYDAAGRVIQTVEGVGTDEDATSIFNFNGRGLLTSSVDPRSRTTTYSYDLNGKVKTAIEAFGTSDQRTTAYEYNGFGDAWKVTDARGNATYSWFDRLGRVTTTRDTENYLTTTSYTVFGEIASVKRWATAATGTPAMATEPTGSGTVATTSFTYTKAGLVLTNVDALNQTETYGYNAFGDRTSVTNRLSLITTYLYNRLGQLARESYAATTVNGSGTAGSQVYKAYLYDSRGNRRQLSEGFTASGSDTALRTTNYEYNASNLLSRIEYDRVTTVSGISTLVTNQLREELFFYDRRRNLIKSVDASGMQTFMYYDDLDQKIAEIRQLNDTQGAYTAYTYYEDGKLKGSLAYDTLATLPSSAGGTPPSVPGTIFRETKYTYDNLNRMLTSEVVNNAANAILTGNWNGSSYTTSTTGNLITQYQYDANDNVVKLTDPNLAVTWNWYDKLGRKTHQLDAEGYITKWDYDAEGNILTETRYATKFTGTPSLAATPSVGTVPDDRITEYGYDANGNRQYEKRKGVIAWSIDVNSGVLTRAGTDSLISYIYNALGQMAIKTVNDVETDHYTYDNAGRLINAAQTTYTDVNGVTVPPNTGYDYDALGNLTRTTQWGWIGTYTTETRETNYRYGEGGRLLSITDAIGKIRNFYYDLAGRQTHETYARVINTNDAANSNALTIANDTRRTIYDKGGRAIQTLIYSNGNLIDYASFRYNAFDQVSEQGSGSDTTSIGAGSAKYQTQNQYDGAGRLVASNAGDGIWKFFAYDRAGNQTGAITSAGANFTSAQNFAERFTNITNADVNGTYTVYDKRNMATQVVEEGRGRSDTITSEALTTSRSYNAFGELASETNAADALITYSYNTMGRMIRSESPGITIVNEDGSSKLVRPSEDYYYDLGGRRIGTRDANGAYTVSNVDGFFRKAADTGNLTSYVLLAGTGYDGKQALISTEFHADGGKRQTLYDIMGEARIIRDELYSSGTPNLHVTEQQFNGLGQLITVKHNRRTNVSDDSTRLVDNYVYDQFGLRLQHWNNQYGSSVLEKSGYDALGRITSQTDMEGHYTTTNYSWNGTLQTQGSSGLLGTYGGWVEVAAYAATVGGTVNFTATTQTDLFGRELFKNDLGGHQFTSTYDSAGRLAQRTTGSSSQTWQWYNSGLLKQTTGAFGTETYSYDKTGNRLTEKLVLGAEVIKDAVVDYDALGRMTRYEQAQLSYVNGSSTTYITPAVRNLYSYDAVGNIRNTNATSSTLNASGAILATATDDFWYRYDAMNRLVLDKGQLSGTQIVRGVTPPDGVFTRGQEIAYDAAGQRKAVIRTDRVPGPPQKWQEVREEYEYNGDGTLSAILINKGLAVIDPNSPPAPQPGDIKLVSSFTYDLMGRQLTQIDKNDLGTQIYSRTSNYNQIGQVTNEVAWTKRYNTGTLYTTNNYFYTTIAGSYLLGVVDRVTGDTRIDSGSTTGTRTDNSYQWFDGAVQSQIKVTANTALPTKIGQSDFNIDPFGQLNRVTVDTDTSAGPNARDRNIYFKNDGAGQIIRRDEVDGDTSGGDPHEIWYRFNGRQLGFTGNNSTDDRDTEGSIVDRQTDQGTGAFRNGTTIGFSYGDFSSSYDPLNSYNQGSTGGSYQVQQTGETLRGIAQQLWGDAALWYKIADANGLQGEATLAEGQRLTIPVGVMRNTHNASTLRPYDANEATGNVSPTTPKPKKPNKCGVFGQILLAAVAIAVVAIAGPALIGQAGFVVSGVTAGGLAVPAVAVAGTGLAGTLGAVGGAIVGGAIAGAAGSLVSQGVGIATGIQSKFSFKGVAISAISAGVSAGLAGTFPSGIAGSAFLGDAARGALSSAISQGIGVATGMQSKFSWTGAAAAGVGAGVGSGIAREWKLEALTGSGKSFRNIAGNTLAGTASAMANAATRSAMNGSSFGDNIMRALPDAIGSTIGNLVADSLTYSPKIAYADVGSDDAISGGVAAGGSHGTEGNASARTAVGIAGGDQVGISDDGMAPEIIVIAGRRQRDMLWTMSNYQWGEYLRKAGPQQYNDMTAIWALSLRQPYDKGDGVRASFHSVSSHDSPLIQSLKAASPYAPYSSGPAQQHMFSDGSLFSGTPSAVGRFKQQKAIQADTEYMKRITGSTIGGIALGVSHEMGASPATQDLMYGLGRSADGILLSSAALRGGSIGPFTGSNSLNIINGENGVHGNSRLSGRTTYLYELYQKDGTFLKYGISVNPNTRYSSSFMKDKDIFRITSGTRSDMIALERQMVISNPTGLLNREAWAVKARGGN